MTTRPERVSADEIRQRMLDAGRELALEAGAALTIEQLRLEEVIRRARVPRSSAYRLWSYKDDYISDLLCYLAGAGSWFSDRPVMTPETTTVVRQLVDENRALLARPEGRRALLCEIVRVTAESNYLMLSQSPQWRLHMALEATLGSTSGDAAGANGAAGAKGAVGNGGGTAGNGGTGTGSGGGAALEAAQARSREVMVAVLEIIMAELGLRLREPSWTAEHLQLAGGLFVQALALRNVQVQAALAGGGDGGTAAHVDALLNAPVPGPGLHGGTAQWSVVAFGYLGLIDAFVELDPDFAPAR